jgi:hypothetical protein
VTARFEATRAPDREIIARAAALSPANPFLTPNCVGARCAGGMEAWLFRVCDDKNLMTGCPAYVRAGRLGRLLEIQTLPRGVDALFWSGVERFCREQRITDLVIDTFGAEPTSIPAIATETARKRRSEYVVDLRAAELHRGLSSGHRRNLARGEKAGLRLRIATDAEACANHASLMAASMTRRHARGESVSGVAATTVSDYVVSGAGALYQALQGDAVLSSILVLHAERGAYYHSAGTSPEGMGVGASHFLVYNVARTLAEKGFEAFNLGGADEAGLSRFKSGFGSTKIDLEAVRCLFGSALRTKLVGMLRDWLNRDGGRWLRRFAATRP